MKVLYVTRPTVFSGPGGDTVQLINTSNSLKSFDVDVTVSEDICPDYTGYDLVHFFNLRNPQDLLHNVRRAKRFGIPSVLSTIWGSYLEGDRATRTGLQGVIARNFEESSVEFAKALARVVVNRNYHPGMLQYFLRGHLSAQKEICNLVDVLLPNSPTELDRVRSDMEVLSKTGVVVHNAVDRNIFNFDKTIVSSCYHRFSEYVVCAARIEPRKCQLELIKACMDINQPLLIVGQPSPNSNDYYKKCRMLADESIVFLHHVEHRDLAQIFKSCAIHALVSWMETPGLSSLEAAAMGCNLVVTEKGDTRFYFGESVEYVDPGSVVSIRAGLMRAKKRAVDRKFQNYIIDNFNWDVTASQTYAGYNLALEGHENL